MTHSPDHSQGENAPVRLSAQLEAGQRDALRVIGARYGLTLSTTVAAIGIAAVQDDERLHSLLAEHSASAQRPRGGDRT